MTLTDAAIENALSGKRILIVEDDTPLAQRIARLLSAKTGLDPVVVGCMEEARLRVVDNRFDLGIVDCMIPDSLEDQQKIQEFEQDIRKIKVTIREIHPSTNDPREIAKLAGARDARAAALADIDGLIDPKGGIKLVKEWRGAAGGGPADFPVLYLTAVSARDRQEEGQSVAGGRVAWLVKPVSSLDILKECVTLLGHL